MILRRSDYTSLDAYLHDLRRLAASGDPEAANQLEAEERRIIPEKIAWRIWEEERDVNELFNFLKIKDPYGDSPEFYLPRDITAEEASDLLNLILEEDESFKSFAFDLSEALYQYCTEWNSGQGSILYRILSQLDFSPGMGWRNMYENPAAFMIYENLVNLEQKPQTPEPLEDLPDNLVILAGSSFFRQEAHIIQIGYLHTRFFLVLDTNFEGALEEAVNWCAENAPGVLTQPEYELENGQCIHCGASYQSGPCKHIEKAEADLTYCDPGLWINSEEWTGYTVDYDRAKATQLQRAQLIEKVRPAWGFIYLCDDEYYEYLPEGEECEDLDGEWGWYINSLENEIEIEEVYSDYDDVVDAILAVYQVNNN